MALVVLPGLVEKLPKSLRMSVELLFEYVEALKAMLQDRNELSVKGLEGVEGVDFGHGQSLVDEDRRIAAASGLRRRNQQALMELPFELQAGSVGRYRATGAGWQVCLIKRCLVFVSSGRCVELFPTRTAVPLLIDLTRCPGRVNLAVSLPDATPMATRGLGESFWGRLSYIQ